MFPVANSTKPFWLTEPHALADHRSTAQLPEECDVAIIGSGFTGSATAYYLLVDDPTLKRKLPPSPKSVVVLEARQACSGASGRNGGHVKPDIYFNFQKLAPIYGDKAAADVSRFEVAHIPAVRSLIAREQIDCDFHLTRAVDVYLNDNIARQTEAAYKRLLQLGVIDTSDVEYTPERDAEAISGVKGAKCSFSFTAAHLWPYKLITHLLARAVSAGANLQTSTPVSQVSSTPDSSGYYTVTTSRGTIRARKVVFATNAYTAGILPEFTGKVIPVRGICSRITVGDGTKMGSRKQHLPNTYSLRWSDKTYDYLIPRADGSIVVGGGRHNYNEMTETWLGVTDDSKLIERAKNYFDGYMQRHFRGWEESGAKTDKVWTGIMGYTDNITPYVGPVPGRPGQFVSAGFGGHGMPRMLLCSRAIASLVRDDSLTIDQTDVPSAFWTSEQRIANTKNVLLDHLKEEVRERVLGKRKTGAVSARL